MREGAQVNLFAFQYVPVAGLVAVFLLEIVFLIAIAKWCGVDFVVILLERLLNRYLRN
jgi:hypothetical protein